MQSKSQFHSLTSHSQDYSNSIDVSAEIKRRKHRFAFTLTELLTGICIIGVLTAVVFPVFVTSREKARGSTCLSNLRQLTQGVRSYAEDYDSTLPLWQFDNGTKVMRTDNPPGIGTLSQDYSGRPVYFWMTAIYPFVKNSKVYLCPSAPQTKYSLLTGKVPYGLNITGQPLAEHPCTPVAGGQITDIPRQSETALLLDGGPVFGMDGDKCKEIDNVSRSLAVRHNGGVNVGFVDGHAKRMTKETLLGDVDRWIIP